MNSKILSSILCILLSIIIIWFLILPAYSAIKEKNNQYAEKEARISSMEKTVSKLESLAQSYEKNGDKTSLVLQMAPKGMDVAGFLWQLEAISSQSGVILYSVSLGSGSTASSASSEGGSATAEKSFAVDLKISGSYEAFRNFLSGLETGARLTDVESFSFVGGGSSNEGPVLYDFLIKALLHYQ